MSRGPAGRLADLFIHSKLTPLLLAAALGVGLYSTLTMPSEEEPQIIVPVADIFVSFPGREPAEIENRVLVPLEAALTGIEGVEYVYTHAERGMALATVRFEVGRDMEESQVRLWSTLLENADRMPPGASPPLIKTVTIDDVPFFTAALFGREGGDDVPADPALREIAEEVRVELEALPDVREVTLIGGRSREVRVEVRPDRLAAYGIDPEVLVARLRMADASLQAGEFTRSDEVFRVQAGSFLTSAADVARVVVDVREGRLVRVEDVARVSDGPAEVDSYTHHWTAEAGFRPMVTLAVAKRPGADATALGRALEDRLDALHGRVVPRDVGLEVTRNYGETAREKVLTLQEHLLLAIVAVGLVVAFSMGWRSAAVVMLAVPVTFALTLLVYRLFGYTLNRVTLFALIFVTGIVIDDSIIVVENMHRHFSMRDRPLRAAARAAIDEVGNPTILATLTVIAAVLPMLFVSGLMGPYMSPMPIGATLAMSFSLLVALIIAPWLAFRLLSKHGATEAEGTVGPADQATPEREPAYALERTRMYRAYRAVMEPLLDSPKRLRWLLGGVGALLLAAVVLFPLRVVTVKMLPFDDKNEMQIIMDLPEGTSLERTAAAARAVTRSLEAVPEVVDAQVYAGTAAPFNFNGLIRHYYLRRGPNVADIQVNLTEKGDRSAQSHDVARRLRPIVQSAAARAGDGVSAKVVEVPPGPPVLSTLVAEVYGESAEAQRRVAREVRELFASHPGVVDVDWSLAADQTEVRFVVDEEKAALSGVPKAAVARALAIALAGDVPANLSLPERRAPVPVRVRLDEASRSGPERLAALHVRSMTGEMVPVGELVRRERAVVPQVIDRKNGRRVVYVTADVAGEEESPVYAILDLNDRIADIELASGASLGQLYARQPGLVEQPVVKWDGEWQITYEVFRDLGIAFAGALLLIYVLIVGWFGSLTTPLIIMVAIPLTLVGIVPGHLVFGAFFTATSMIGMIALAGIMVRNGILLVDYIDARLKAGIDLKTAILESGAVRTRPIALTAGTVAIGALVILFDPIFQGLAVSLISGAIASTVLTLVVVPGIYFLVRSRGEQKEEAS